MTSGDALDFMFNPGELQVAVKVVWQRMQPLGQPHQPQQYTSTENLKIPLELSWDSLTHVREGIDVRAAATWLMSLAYPPRGAGDIRGGAPPRVLFVWPELASLTCVIEEVSVRFTRFATSGTPTAAVARVTLEEIRDQRLTLEDAATLGLQRSAASRLPIE